MDNNRFYSLKIADITRETEETVSISFEVPDDLRHLFHYQPGQYLTLRAMVGGEELRRSYSLCSVPYEQKWSVAVKKVEGGRFSNYANDILKPGDVIDVMPPLGAFVAQYQDGHHLCVAAGSGITPIMSIVRSLLEETDGAKVTLIYGNRRRSTAIFRRRLEELANDYQGRFNIIPFYSQESTLEGRSGRVEASALSELGLDISTLTAAYLCGPSEMIFSIESHLKSAGMEAAKIHFELFTAPVPKETEMESAKVEEPTVQEGPVKLTFIVDDEEHVVTHNGKDDNILDIGLAAGLDLPYSCQGGVCCTCRAQVTNGQADLRQNFSLSDQELEQGFVLTCQTHLKGVDVTVNYDQ